MELGRSLVVEVKSEVQVQFRTDYLMSPRPVSRWLVLKLQGGPVGAVARSHAAV